MRTLLIFSLTAITCLFSANIFAQTISISVPNDTICAGASVTFSAMASGTSTPHYQWYKNSSAVGTDSTGFTTNSLSNGDIIECLLSASVGGPTIALSSGIVMHVYTMPVVSAISGPDSVCRTAVVILTDSFSGGTWSSSNTAIAPVNANGHVLGSAVGTDTITYTITNICGSASASLTMMVKTTPSVLSVTGPGHLCTGTAASVYMDTTSGGKWTTSNTAVATIDSVTGSATPLTPGNINVTYTVTNNCGSTSRNKAIIVSSPPTPGPITGATSVCQSDTIHLHGAAPGGVWSSSDQTIALVGASGGVGAGYGLLAGISAGTVTIKYVVVNFCGADSNTVNITVDPLPVVYPITGTDSVCPGSALNLSDFTTAGTWASVNTAAATVDASGMVTGVANGTSDITYSVTNSCGTTTQTLTVYVYCPQNVGVNNVAVNSEIAVFPNPAHDVISIKGFKPAVTRIANMYGQIVKEVANANEIGVSDLATGIYFVQLFGADGVIVSSQRLEKL